MIVTLPARASTFSIYFLKMEREKGIQGEGSGEEERFGPNPFQSK